MNKEATGVVIGISLAVLIVCILGLLCRKTNMLRGVAFVRWKISTAAEDARQRWIEIICFVASMSFAAFFVYLLVHGFNWLAVLLRPDLPEVGIVLPMSLLGWLNMALLPSMLLGFFPAAGIAKLILADNRFQKLFRNPAAPYAANQLRAALLFILACAAIDAVLLPLASGYYVRIDDRVFAMNRFLSLEEEAVPLPTVSSITHVSSFRAPIGNIVRKPFYEVGFADGRVWTSKDWIVGDLRGTDVVRFIDRLAQMTGKEISSSDPFPR